MSGTKEIRVELKACSLIEDERDSFLHTDAHPPIYVLIGRLEKCNVVSFTLYIALRCSKLYMCLCFWSF